MNIRFGDFNFSVPTPGEAITARSKFVGVDVLNQTQIDPLPEIAQAYALHGPMNLLMAFALAATAVREVSDYADFARTYQVKTSAAQFPENARGNIDNAQAFLTYVKEILKAFGWKVEFLYVQNYYVLNFAPLPQPAFSPAMIEAEIDRLVGTFARIALPKIREGLIELQGEFSVRNISVEDLNEKYYPRLLLHLRQAMGPEWYVNYYEAKKTFTFDPVK